MRLIISLIRRPSCTVYESTPETCVFRRCEIIPDETNDDEHMGIDGAEDDDDDGVEDDDDE